MFFKKRCSLDLSRQEWLEILELLDIEIGILVDYLDRPDPGDSDLNKSKRAYSWLLSIREKNS